MNARTRKLSAFAALWAAVRGQRRPDAPALWTQVLALPRLVQSALSGSYPGADRSRLAMMAAALLYVVSPVDLVPEALFAVLGLGDDAMVLTWLAGAVLSETEAFLRWEKGADQRPSRDGVVQTEVV